MAHYFVVVSGSKIHERAAHFFIDIYSRQRGIAEKSFYYWQRKLRTQIVESASPQLVPLEPPAVSEEQLCIQYRGAELKLPAGVDMDAVAAILRSLQSL